MERSTVWLVILVLFTTSCGFLGEAIWIDVPLSGTKCVSEELHDNVVVMVDFFVLEFEGKYNLSSVSAKVTSPHGNELYHKEDVDHGEFAFTTNEEGSYYACFWVNNHGHQGEGKVNINLDWRIGFAAKDWASIARKNKTEGVHLELKKLEEYVKDIHRNLLYLKDRDVQMKEVSEKTRTRVAVFSILSIGLCITCSVSQSWYLKRYFLKKKLI